MKADLNGKVALITGAGKGIGRAIALLLAENGADIVVNDIDQPAAEEVAEQVKLLGRRASIAIADVADYEAVKQMVKEAVAELGHIDILVNNAGWDKKIEPFIKNQPEDWEKIININFKGPIYCTRAVAEHMMQRKTGKIINISSDAGRVGSFGEAVYSGCKGALIAMAKVWAREFARDGIRVNTICPGLVDTPLYRKLKEDEFGKKILERVEGMMLFGLGKPEDTANAVLFFASDASNHITGQVLSVSGGLTFHG